MYIIIIIIIFRRRSVKYLGERERGVRVKRYMPRVCTSVLSLLSYLLIFHLYIPFHFMIVPPAFVSRRVNSAIRMRKKKMTTPSKQTCENSSPIPFNGHLLEVINAPANKWSLRAFWAPKLYNCEIEREVVFEYEIEIEVVVYEVVFDYERSKSYSIKRDRSRNRNRIRLRDRSRIRLKETEVVIEVVFDYEIEVVFD